MSKIQIIAEVGSNYDNNIEKAKGYIKSSKIYGADAVKFQTLRKDKLISPNMLSNGKLVDNPAYKNFKNLELPEEWHYALKKAADREGIEFISTPLYMEAVDILEKAGVRTYKIASGDITFFPLLEKIADTGKRIILSTGASSLKDIERALDALVKHGAKDITLLHCISNYPPEWDEINLLSIVALKNNFGLPVGISDHSPGDIVPIASAALGAVVIEKHVTVDRASEGPDHNFAMTMEEFGDMVRKIRLVEHALGVLDKAPAASELKKQKRIRRGIYDAVTFKPAKDTINGIWLRPEHEQC